MTSHLICVLLLAVQVVFAIPASSNSWSDLGNRDETQTTNEFLGSPNDILISSNIDDQLSPENSAPPPIQIKDSQNSISGTVSPESNSLSTDGKCKYYESRINTWYTGYCNPGGRGECKDVDNGHGHMEKRYNMYSGAQCGNDQYQCCIESMRCLNPFSNSWCMASSSVEQASSTGTDVAETKDVCVASGGFLESAPISHCPRGLRCCLKNADRKEYDPATMDSPIIHNQDGSLQFQPPNPRPDPEEY